MSVTNYTLSKFFVNSFLFDPEKWSNFFSKVSNKFKNLFPIDLFFPIKKFLRNIKIDNPRIAHILCQIIPAQCPFERDIKIFGGVLFNIPPMCKLNPFYNELMELRFKSLCYLADEAQEDINQYC